MSALRSKVALVTAEAVKPPHHDPDMKPSLAALRKLKIDASAACWDDPHVRWEEFDLAVLRSTWDYVDRYEEFFDWLTSAERRVRVLNPSPIVKWSTNKRYLEDLKKRDMAVVETWFIEPDDPIEIPDLPELVVKPAIGAGARDAARHASADDALEHVRRLLDDERTAMVQPYLSSIDHRGETGLVFFNGVFSHAFKKKVLLPSAARFSDELYAKEKIKRRKPDADELALAESVVEAYAKDLLYARVDVVRDSTDKAVVLEVELAEPSFFLRTTCGRAAKTFARAVEQRL